ncbi:mRNA 3'-end-processing protein rna14 [Coccidioides posadasii str. Silveira]|uniref:mRNA 3'-end-processing protein RNA14 n=2 Tax=Coccidioides posadasii TaxID=199306 RepID=E9D059_COCPS|nr:mRNA 3'-end-processing protein rna14 [Coccidioides posadasii str. Silveira]KMM73126.1 mRNA 3'-end-processing protein rna14 [Coccidioides posadasii RMSCC 3488]QVM08604.1 mRNA 3'-end-processing protein rna14 [Coccidioides posadasii str. Silveira]
MAEDEAERAFFRSQALNMENYETGDDQGANGSDTDEYDPSKTVEDEFSTGLANPQTTMPSYSRVSEYSAPDSVQRGDVSHDFSQVQDPGGAFPSKSPSRSESRTSASAYPSGLAVDANSQATAGDVQEEEVGDGDGGDAEYEPPGALDHVQDTTSTPADIQQRSFSQNSNEIVSPFHVSQQQTVSEKTTPHDVSNNLSSTAIPTGAPVQSDTASKPDEAALAVPSIAQSTNSSIAATPIPTPVSKGRLPHDRVGILEDRIQADPRGDTEAWLELISEHRSRNKLDSARQVYERFFKVFPWAAEQWVAYASMESEHNELYRLEQIFNKSLLNIPSVQLWSVYLDYVRRRNNLTTDTTGQARRIISSAYDFALQNIGIDKDSGPVWVDYIQFIRSGPGNIGGSGWQDQQKMDLLRKSYQRAICVPMQAVNTLWKEYDQFEMGLNKLTGRKFLQERSPSYMTARSSYTELQNITRDLVRASLAKLPPAPGFAGHAEYMKQVGIWKRWIKWEKDDPLVLKEEDAGAYKSRVLYVYKQALMALRFMPDLWFEAADFCFQNGMDAEGTDMLKQGIEANPESCLLAFKRGDQLEITTASEQDRSKRGTLVREPYDKLLDALYDLITKAKVKEAQDIAQIEEKFAEEGMQPTGRDNDEEEEEDESHESKAKTAAKAAEIETAKKTHGEHIRLLSKTISYAWIALMRAMRRIQGKGKPGEIAGSRQIFADARKRGRITSDVYIASALIEYHCYKDPAATKIFERGAKLFPEDENFALEYLKHLIDINDVTNARAVFETTVRRLASNPENVAKAKPIFAFLHEYESRYGDLTQIISLEKRMRELFPEDPTLQQFSHRYSGPLFDPTSAQFIISPTQTRLKQDVPLEEFHSRQESPAGPVYLSPKRAFPVDDLDDDFRPRKFMRAESPLKGAAGRRLDQKRGHQANGSGANNVGQARAPAQAQPLPRDIVYLLSIIPPASTYDSVRFIPENMVNLLRQVDIPSSVSQLRPPIHNPTGAGRPQYGGR